MLPSVIWSHWYKKFPLGFCTLPTLAFCQTDQLFLPSSSWFPPHQIPPPQKSKQRIESKSYFLKSWKNSCKVGMQLYRWNLTPAPPVLALDQAKWRLPSPALVPTQLSPGSLSFVCLSLEPPDSSFLWDLGSWLQTLESIAEHPLPNNFCLLECQSNVPVTGSVANTPTLPTAPETSPWGHNSRVCLVSKP